MTDNITSDRIKWQKRILMWLVLISLTRIHSQPQNLGLNLVVVVIVCVCVMTKMKCQALVRNPWMPNVSSGWSWNAPLGVILYFLWGRYKRTFSLPLQPFQVKRIWKCFSLSLYIYIYYMFQGMKWERRGFIGAFELALYQWISSSIHNEYVYVFILLDLITHHKASSQITFNNLIIYNLPAALFNEIISTAIQHKLCSLIFKIQVTSKKIIYGSSFFTS